MLRRIEALVDIDAFYAYVEERDDPSLVGKPVIVGGSAENRGVVAAANYDARKYVHIAIAASRAKRLYPQAVFIKPRKDHYAAVSKQIRDIFENFTPQVDLLSLDEAFLDVAGSERLRVGGSFAPCLTLT